MKAMGLALVLVGVGAFFLANSQRAGYDTVEGKLKTTFSQSERENSKFWETARIGGIGVAVFGAIMYVRGLKPR